MNNGHDGQEQNEHIILFPIILWFKLPVAVTY